MMTIDIINPDYIGLSKYILFLEIHGRASIPDPIAKAINNIIDDLRLPGPILLNVFCKQVL